MYLLDYHDSQAYEQRYEEFIQDEMEKQRAKSLQRLCSIIPQEIAEDFSKILVAAYEYGSPEAEKWCEQFSFNSLDLLALDEDFKGYKEDFEERQKDFWLD